MALYATDSYQVLLWLRIAVEILANQSMYNITSTAFCLRDLPVVTPTYQQLLINTLTDGSYAELVHLVTASNVLQIRVQFTSDATSQVLKL